MNFELAKADVIDWIVNFVEKPNPLLNGWAPCPYARQARLQNRVDIRPGTDPEHDLQQIAHTGMQLFDVIALVYDPQAWPLSQFRQRWETVQNNQLTELGLYVLEDHPQEPEQVLGVVMNQGKWALLFVQERHKLESAAQQLAAKGYYHNWPEEYLQSLFHGRSDPRQ